METSRSKPVRLALLWLCAFASASAGQRYPADWARAREQAIEHLVALVRIDTRNPPGNETRAANYIHAALEREGIPSELFALEPDRANLVARLKGNGSKKPILILGHTDVVGVQREKWSVDPFAGLRKDGFIYGRGATDDKPHAAAGLVVMTLLKRLNVKLDRDIIFLAEAGEEGTTNIGIDFMVDRHWDRIAAEYALAEGGHIESQNGKARFVEITTTEKVPRGVRLVAHGTAGHGSRPIPDNAVVRLASAVAKVGAWHTPMRLCDTTRAYFERLAAISPPEQAWRYNHIADAARGPEIDRYFFEHEPAHYSILRTSVTPTIVKAGFRSNVIPSEAEAYLDVRALPDEDMDRFCAEMRRVVGDAAVEVIPPKRGRPAGAPSRIDSEMFRALETVQRRMFPGAITLPSMLTGATDLAQLRARGVQAYGFGPVVEAGETGGPHADDERLAEDSLFQLVQFLWYTVQEVAASK